MAAVAGKDDNVGEVVDHVLATRERVFVERNGAPAAVIMSARELEGLEYTIDLLSEPRTVRRILAAEAALQVGTSTWVRSWPRSTQTPDSSCVP